MAPETTPHLHIDFVPYTSGNTRGLREENKALNAVNKSLAKELNQHNSIKNRLSMAGVEAELSNVKKLLNRILEFVEKIGFKAQLEKFLNQKIDKVKNR